MLRRQHILMFRSRFFVDSNVIIDYQKNVPHVRPFIDHSGINFFYGETTKGILESGGREGTIPKVFSFKESNLSLDTYIHIFYKY
jgi:hypothetical protein